MNTTRRNIPERHQGNIEIVENLISPRFQELGPKIQLPRISRKVAERIAKNVEDGSYEFEKVECPVCFGTRFERLGEVDRYGLYTPISICVKCGLIQQNPRMTEQSLANFYESDYRPLHDTTTVVGEQVRTNDHFSSRRLAADRFRRSYSQAAPIYKFIENNIPIPMENLRILDVGMGAGGTLKYFEERGHTVTGCDLGSEYVEYAREVHDLDGFVGTIDDLGVDISEFDLVLYIGVLEHIPNPVDQLSTLHSLVEDVFVYNTQWGLYAYEKYQMDILRKIQLAHIYYPSLRTMTNIFRSAGFSLVSGTEDIHSIYHSVQEPGEYVSDYSHALEFLNGLERRRFLYLNYYLQHPKLKTTLKRFGLLGFAEESWSHLRQLRPRL